MKRVPLVALLAVALLIPSCRWDAHAPLDAAVVLLTLAPAVAVSGDTVHVAVLLANPTDRVLRFVPARSVCYLDFEVRDSAAVQVGWSGMGCVAIVPQPVEIAPHGTRQSDFTWRVRTCSAPGLCADAAPGHYTLRGLADVGGPAPLPSPAVGLQVLPR